VHSSCSLLRSSPSEQTEHRNARRLTYLEFIAAEIGLRVGYPSKAEVRLVLKNSGELEALEESLGNLQFYVLVGSGPRDRERERAREREPDEAHFSLVTTASPPLSIFYSEYASMNKRANYMGQYFTQSLSGRRGVGGEAEGGGHNGSANSFPQFAGCLCNLACQIYSRHVIGFSDGIVRSDFLSLSLASAHNLHYGLS